MTKYEALNKTVLMHREAGRVERCHTLPHHGSYTNGQHTHDATSLLFLLHPKPSLRLVRALHFHDVAERWVGDMPAPAKKIDDLGQAVHRAEAAVMKQLGHDYKLTKNERRWLKAVDTVEFYLWCADQVAMGNQHVAINLATVVKWMDKMDLPEQVEVFLAASGWMRTGI